MTNPVGLPPYSLAPTIPSIGSASFSTDVQNFFAWQVGAATGANVVGLSQSCVTNAMAAYEAAQDAKAAAAGANVNLWDAVTVYSVGTVVKSPAALAAGAANVTYVCKVATGSTHIDPYSDPARWAIFMVSGGVGGAVYTTSTTLTSASPFAISISGGSGVWLKLQDATTMQKGIAHAVRNTGDNDVTLLDATGAKIGFIRPQCGTIIAIADNSSAAGKWVGDWEIYGLTADLSLNLSISSNNIFSTAVKIDQNKTMFLYGQTGSGLYAVVYDTATQTATDSLLVRASAQYCQAVLIGGNVAVMTCDNGTAIQVALISPACALVSTASATASGTVNSFGQFIALGAGYVFSYSTSAPAGIVRAISVSGTTLSIGSEASLTSAESPRLYVNGSYLLALRHNNSNGIYCTAYTLSGNTLTAGSSVNTPAGTYYSDSVRSFQHSSNDIVCYHVYNGFLVCNVFRLSGATLSVNSVNLFSWSSGHYGINYFAHVAMGDGRVLFGGIYNGSDLISIYMTNTSGTPSTSSSLSIRCSNSTVRAKSNGFFVSNIGFSFDFAKASPELVNTQYCANIGNLSGVWMDRLGRFVNSIVSNTSSLIAFGSFDPTGDVVTVFGKFTADSPQKNKITIPAQPTGRGDSASASICCTSITTNNYGFRILRISCID